MTRLLVASLVLFSSLMAFLLFLIIVFSAALLIFSRGKKKTGEERIKPLIEAEEIIA